MDVTIETIGTADQGCDYTTFATWDAIVDDGIPEIFHIGVVYPAILLEDDFERHHFTLQIAPYDYLLVTFSGEIIAWKLKENLCIIRDGAK